MIAKLTGRIEQIEADRCIVDVNGVGYLVNASTRTLAALPPGQAASLLIETHVREDAIVLYGFSESAEREWFRVLTTVQGVGAKVALNILSALAPRELIAAIQSGDRGALTRAPGVGAKLAVRLLTELREKAGAMPAGIGFSPVLPPAGGVEADALSALLHLGYRRAEAQAAIAKALARLGDDAALDAVIRDGLKELAR
ncbi:MAG: Holliday junction branch migration protein RuvA [Acetobacteraceae bacterium]|nr:Holliday junction branch migration protein RuvA [Acetobacteraceae bacterium]